MIQAALAPAYALAMAAVSVYSWNRTTLLPLKVKTIAHSASKWRLVVFTVPS